MMKMKNKAFALLAAAAVAVSSFAGAVNVSAYTADSAAQEGAAQVLQASGLYTVSPNKTIVYSQLPSDDKMIGFSWADFGINTSETIEKVEIEVSTTGSSIGKWQGAFGSSTTDAANGYWTQTDDMEQTISGKSGTITWDVDSASGSIIQTQYGGELKWGIWWIDCGTVTVDNINVYTDAYTGGSSDSGDSGSSDSGSTSSGGYTIEPNETIVYSQLPADDKMIGWSWADFGIGTDETIQKVEINISTTGSSIGKWQGAFGSSTTDAANGYWTQTDDMEQSISGKSGTITWDVDSATAAIIQTQYGGELKWGIWWIDCGTITVDSITVYTDKSGSAATTTTTTTTTKTTTTTTTKTTTTTTKTTTSKTTTTATTTKITSDTVPAGDMYVQMAGRAGDSSDSSKYIPAGASGADCAYIGLEFYNAEEEMLTMRGQYRLGDALAEIATPYLDGEWIETYDMAFGSEVWIVNPDNLVFAANSTFLSENVFADGEMVFGSCYEIADAATVKAVAEKYGIAAEQAEDGTWFYAFPIHLETSFNWEWIGVDEVNFYPNNLALVETSYVYILAEEPDTTTTTSTTATTTTTTTTTTKTTTSTDPVWNDLIGDVNLDGKVSVLDIIRLNKYNAQIVTLNAQALRNAECCSDGVINGSDLTALMQYLVDLVDALPVA